MRVSDGALVLRCQRQGRGECLGHLAHHPHRPRDCGLGVLRDRIAVNRRGRADVVAHIAGVHSSVAGDPRVESDPVRLAHESLRGTTNNPRPRNVPVPPPTLYCTFTTSRAARTITIRRDGVEPGRVEFPARWPMASLSEVAAAPRLTAAQVAFCAPSYCEALNCTAYSPALGTVTCGPTVVRST